VKYESFHQIHVSGHGCQEELLMLLSATKPKYFIPIHGYYRHLYKHAKLAKEAGVLEKNVFVIEDGQTLEITADSISLGENLPLQKRVVFENTFMESSPALFTQRLNLSKTGVVFAALMRHPKSKKLLEAPSIKSYGLMYRHGEREESVTNEAQSYLYEVYNDAKDEEGLEDTIRLEMRRFYKKHVSHKPLIIPIILDV
jgi:ribonuclease J